MKSAEDVAQEVLGHLGDACGDVAYETETFLDEDVKKKFKKAKANGVTDLVGWYADELYNDKDFIRDITGDYVCDKARESNVSEIDIYEAMTKIGHTAFQENAKARLVEVQRLKEKIDDQHKDYERLYSKYQELKQRSKYVWEGK